MITTKPCIKRLNLHARREKGPLSALPGFAEKENVCQFKKRFEKDLSRVNRKKLKIGSSIPVIGEQKVFPAHRCNIQNQ